MKEYVDKKLFSFFLKTELLFLVIILSASIETYFIEMRKEAKVL